MTTATERIRTLIERNGWSQTQAAEYLGVPKGTLLNWLQGIRNPPTVVERLLTVLGTVEALAPGLHATMLPKPRPAKGRPSGTSPQA